jgi:Cytochrome C'
MLVGCPEEPRPAKAPQDDAPAVVPTGPPTTAPLPGGDQALLRRPKLPDDVFFDDPLAIVANRTRVRGAPETPATVTDTPPEEKPAEPETPSATQAVDWAALLPADILAAEVNRIRERFAPKLTSVATFNNSLLDFPPYAAELAALGGIATEHSGNLPWKAEAKYVRDLSGQMLSDQLQRGQKSYEQIKQPFDKVVAILDGKRPADLPEADDATDFSVVADYSYLMRRFDAGENVLKTSGGSEAAFKQNAADLARETRVLAALSKVVAREEYGYGDDTKFQGFATAMSDAAVEAAKAAEAGDFATFDTARNALGQSCVQCHGEYRNN